MPNFLHQVLELEHRAPVARPRGRHGFLESRVKYAMHTHKCVSRDRIRIHIFLQILRATKTPKISESPI